MNSAAFEIIHSWEFIAIARDINIQSIAVESS